MKFLMGYAGVCRNALLQDPLPAVNKTCFTAVKNLSREFDEHKDAQVKQKKTTTPRASGHILDTHFVA